MGHISDFLINYGPIILSASSLIYFILNNKDLYHKVFKIAFDIIFIFILPSLFFMFFDGPRNDCCYGTAVFSPNNKLTIYTLVYISIASYFYIKYKADIHNPILEVIANLFLLIGITFNVTMYIHLKNNGLFWTFNFPIIIWFIQELIRSHRLLLSAYFTTRSMPEGWKKYLIKFVKANAFVKFPILYLFCLPLLLLLIIILLLFGQEPDSIIRAYTDTYKQGFSQLDHMCNDVVCNDHYLCTIAANGHNKIVKPVRIGERRGETIICNRQLLVSNAFEELIQEKFPRLHKLIRRHYDKVGDMVQKHYHLFRHKWVSDLIYILMKPLEWFFVIALYIADNNPENRIAQQYLRVEDRKQIKLLLEKN